MAQTVRSVVPFPRLVALIDREPKEFPDMCGLRILAAFWSMTTIALTVILWDAAPPRSHYAAIVIRTGLIASCGASLLFLAWSARLYRFGISNGLFHAAVFGHLNWLAPVNVLILLLYAWLNGGPPDIEFLAETQPIVFWIVLGTTSGL